MTKNFKWVFFAFTLLIATILPYSAEAASATQIEKASQIGKYFVFKGDGYALISSSPFILKGELDDLRLSGTFYLWEDGEWVERTRFGEIRFHLISYTNHDLKTSDGTVFFSAPQPPIPKALSQVLPNLLIQATKILPVGLVVLSALLVTSLIPKVLYRLF